MTVIDTIDIRSLPFSQWGNIPYNVEPEAPDIGVAVNDTFNLFFVPDSSAMPVAVRRLSFFAEHAFVPHHSSLMARTDLSTPVWVFVVLVALVTLMILYYRNRKLRFKDLLPLLFDSRAMDRTLRNNNFNSRFRFIPMGLLMLAVVLLPVHQIALARNGIGGYFLLVAAVIVLYLLRNGLIRLLAVVFDNGVAMESYITSNYFYHLALATLALPLVFLQTYLPQGGDVVLYILAGVTLLELILRLFRGMKLFLTQSSGPYIYLFYYLCIVEMAPILVLVKWFIE